jgi:ABC-type multidrug transport system ATPase subunit
MFATSNRVGKSSWPDENGWDRDAVNQTYLMEPQMWVPQFVQFAPLPIMGFRITLFYYYCDFALALLFILIYLDNMYTVVTTFISEKETRMREVLRIQGVSTYEFIASWFVSYVAQFAALNFVIACVCVFPMIGTTGFGGIFSTSSLLAVWWFLFLYSMAFVAKGFTIACFFGKARIGGMISLILYLSGWFIQAALKYQPSSATSKALLAFVSPVGAFAFGVELLSKLEEAGAGATWANFDFRPDGATGLSFGDVMWLMFAQFIFYCILGWYFDQVVPSQWGIKESPLFFLTSEYWTRGSSGAGAGGSDKLAAAPQVESIGNPVGAGVHIDETTVEMEQMRRDHKCIDIKNLRKTFPTPDGEFVAVNDLNMTMFEGQIFSLLGHNGAGKTTTISMLTGMLPPTSGDATVYGKSIVGDMPGVREDIGFCPQHDVLYPSLTVHEHLSMFASLKGIPDAEVEAVVMSKIADVGLTEKVNYQSGGLSGGQKRKLSLAMALIGDCKAIFLDEPTSGMDPYSRRSTWNMLQAARAGRVMVLTTHFMDEADILGDRIGIMAKGQLRCCGSSLFLKAQYGGGYNLAFAKTSTDPAEALQRTITSRVPGTKVISNIGTELKCQLPLTEVSAFPALFAELEAKQQQYGFESYGIGLTNMEEVFLRVAEEGEVEQAELSNDAEEEGVLTDHEPGCQSCGKCVLNSGTFKDGDPSWYGCGSSFVKHLFAMYIKRARYGIRDRRAQVCNIITPILLLWFGFFLMYDLLGTLIERDLPEVTLDLNIVKDELQLDSLPVPYNATYPQEQPGVSRFPGGVIAHPEQVELGPEEREVFGVVYNDGKPLGEESCTMEPREMLAFSEQLLREGMGSDGEDVVYGAVMFPSELADCCADYEIPCAQVQQIMVTGLGLDCEVEMHELASPGGSQFLKDHIGGRGPVIANMIGLEDTRGAGTAEQQLDGFIQQGADSVALVLGVAGLLGVGELATASFADFCPGVCAGEEFNHWNSAGALAAMIRNRYRVCPFAKRAVDNGNAPIETLIGVLQTTGMIEAQGPGGTTFMGCDTTPVQLAERAAPLVMALSSCVRSLVCGTALNAAMALYPVEVSTQDLFMLLGGLNQTAGVMKSLGMGDLTLAQACPDTCGDCNRTAGARPTPAQTSPAMTPSRPPRPPRPSQPPPPAPSPSPALPPCVDDASVCDGVGNGICEERHIEAPCESTHSCHCPAGSDATDCASFRGDCSVTGSGRRMQSSDVARPPPPPVTKLTILYNSSFTHATPVFLSVGSNLLKNQFGGGGSIVVRGTMAPFTDWQKYNSDVSVVIGIFQSLVVCLFTIIAFSFIPGALVEFVVREREHNRNAKHQQYVSGASIPAYWFGNYLWDMTMITMPIAATLTLAAWFEVSPLVRGDAPFCCFVLFLGYGLAICPFTYLMGNLFSSSAKAQIYTILFNLMTGIVMMVGSYVLGQFYKTHDINEVLMWGYRIFPGFCLGHGLLQIFINNNEITAAMTADMFGGSGTQEMSMFDWNIAGKDLLYLYFSAVFYTLCVLGYDFLKAYPALAKKLHDKLPGSSGQVEAVQEVASQIVFDEDVVAEAERVASGGADGDAVKLDSLQKVYPGGKMAVKNISVGIPLGECFGLLGINGKHATF